MNNSLYLTHEGKLRPIAGFEVYTYEQERYFAALTNSLKGSPHMSGNSMYLGEQTETITLFPVTFEQGKNLLEVIRYKINQGVTCFDSKQLKAYKPCMDALTVCPICGVYQPESAKCIKCGAPIEAEKEASAERPDVQKAQADEIALSERFLSLCKGLPYGVCRGALQKAIIRTGAIVGDRYNAARDEAQARTDAIII